MIADELLDRYGGSSGFALLASVTLHSVPENLALGVGQIGSSRPASSHYWSASSPLTSPRRWAGRWTSETGAIERLRRRYLDGYRRAANRRRDRGQRPIYGRV